LDLSRKLIPLIQRFIDYIPLAIEHELNQGLSDNIRNTLIQAIFDDSQNGRIHLADLLNEDPAIASRRIDLEDKIGRLQNIMARLEGFEPLELPEVQDSEVNSEEGSFQEEVTGSPKVVPAVLANAPSANLWGVSTPVERRNVRGDY